MTQRIIIKQTCVLYDNTLISSFCLQKTKVCSEWIFTVAKLWIFKTV